MLDAAASEHVHGGEHAAHGSESFRELLRERLISIGTMDRRLRLLVGAAVAQLLVAALMIALRGVDMPRIVGDIAGNDEQSVIPLATFVVAVVLAVVAWSFVLAGALQAHWLVRIVIVGLFGWSVAVEEDVPGATFGGTVAACVLCAALIVLTLATIVRDRREPHPHPRLLGWRFALVLPLVAGLFITAWLSSSAGGDPENFQVSVAQHLYYLQYALIPLLVLAGADFADWGHVLGTRAAVVLRRVRSAWPLLAVTVLIAAGMLVDSLRVIQDESGETARMLILGGILAAVAVLLTVLVRTRQTWPAQFPFAALAAVVVVDAGMGFLIEHFSPDNDTVSDNIYAITATVWLGLAFASLLALAVWRRMPPMLVATATFVVLIGVCDVLFGLQSIASVYHSLNLNSDSTALDLNGVRAVAAIATLVIAVAVALRRRLREDVWLIGGVLAVDVSIQVIAWVDLLFTHTASVSEKLTGGFSIGAGVVLLVALLLELVASGDAITNRHGRWLPRPSRVLLYLGYILMVATAVLYFASLHSPDTGALREAGFESESWVQEGVTFLGPPLVLALAIGGIVRHRMSVQLDRDTSSRA